MPLSFEYLLLLIAGLIAGVINTVAGGGSFLTLPALMALGLGPGVANGTNRIAVVLQALVGAWQFHRAGHVDYALVKRLAPPLVVGAIGGAWLASILDARRFETAFGILLIVMGLTVFLKPKLTKGQASARRRPAWLVVTAFLAIGLFSGFIQAGVGILFVSASVLLLRISPVLANSVKLTLVFIFTLPALIVFAIHGQVELVPGLVLSVGNAAGSWLGVKVALGVSPRLLLAAIALIATVTGVVLLL